MWDKIASFVEPSKAGQEQAMAHLLESILQGKEAIEHAAGSPDAAWVLLDDALTRRGVQDQGEGHVAPAQAVWLREQVVELSDGHSRPVRCLETGFNMGHSAAAMLVRSVAWVQRD